MPGIRQQRPARRFRRFHQNPQSRSFMRVCACCKSVPQPVDATEQRRSAAGQGPFQQGGAHRLYRPSDQLGLIAHFALAAAGRIQDRAAAAQTPDPRAKQRLLPFIIALAVTRFQRVDLALHRRLVTAAGDDAETIAINPGQL